MLLPPVQHTAPMTDKNGILTAVWSDWFKKLFFRAGEHDAYSNAELLLKCVPTGATLEFYGTAAPTQFLLCDGSAVSRTTYADLFAVIGTACGVGNGTTTFNLPAAGKFSVSKNSGTFSTLGATGGAETAALPNHLHSVSLTSGTPSATAAMTAGAATVASDAHTHSVSGNTGNPTTSPTVSVLPPYQVANRIIKI